jgi:hypothetical protein
MRAFQGNFNAGIVGPAMYSRTDLGKYTVGVKDAVNLLVRPEGGLFNRAGTRIASGYDTSTVDGKQWLIPFDLSDDARFMLEFGDNVMRVMFEGSYVFRPDVGARPISSVSAANPAKIVMGSSGHAASFTVGHLAYVSDPNGTSVFHGQVVEITAISGTDVTFKIVGGTTVNTSTGDWGTIGASAELLGIYQLASPYAIEDLPYLVTAQDLETLYIAHPDYEPRTLTITAPNDWAFAIFATGPDIAAPGSPAAVATVGTGAVTYKYKVAAISAETREESLPSAQATVNNNLAIAGNKNTFSWATVADASSYKVYKDFNGIFGYIGITEGLSFVDENITPDTLDNPQSGREPFDGAGNYPGLFAFVEQRLAAAGSINQPQAVEMSTSVSPRNFNRALTPGDSDAITFRARAQRQNKIVAIVPSDEPVIFTKGAEGFVRGGDDKGYLTPTNLVLKTTTYRGSAEFPKPLLVGESIIHVQRDGSTIREYVPQRTDQESADLTLLVRHLFKGRTVKTWAYAQAPDSVVWVTTDRGELYSLTYLVEHEVWGWTRHTLGGTDVFVHQVEVLPGVGYDQVYLVVSRTLYGGTVTWTERMDPRDFAEDVTLAYFVDGGLTFEGSSQVVRGFLHLRGEDVAVLADGSVLEGVTVTAQGRVDLQATTSIAHIGLSYIAELTTLAVDFTSPQEGSAIGRLKASASVIVMVEATRGISVGREGGFLNEMKQFEGDEPIPLETGTFRFDVEGDWVIDARITVRQSYPLPMTVTGVAPDWETSDT